MRNIKFFILFAFLLFLVIGYKTYDEYHRIEETQKLIILSESQSLASFISAFRQTYQDVFLRHGIEVDEKTIHLLPVKTTREISNRFSKSVQNDVVIRTVSDRPRNMANMANNFELSMIEYFKKNPSETEKFIKKEKTFYYSKPLLIKPSCLKCHGKREDAIPSIRDKYANAYDYKLGELRGLLNIEVKEREFFAEMYYDFAETVIAAIILYIIFLVIIYLLIKKMHEKELVYTKKLESEIFKKTYEIEDQKKILHMQAHYDGLTGLPNRLLFNDRLEHALKHAKRHNSITALFFIDIDHFKYINDTLGHQIGDKVLMQVAKLLRLQLREEDTLARLGGDEFTIIIEDLQKFDDASILAKKLHNILKETISIEEHMLHISFSIGISFYPKDSDDADTLLNYADAAMYKSKELGRNNTQYYSEEMTKLAHKRINTQNNLREALKNKEFIIHYQPQVDVKRDKIVGMEALVRWNHPKKGLIYPVDFIEIAEDTGMIIELDTWVMKTAMMQIIYWYKKGLNPGILSLNLSKRQLENDAYVAELYQTMNTLKFNPMWLELEITESRVMQRPEECINKLQQISEMGVSIAIDDFGTGYSSLEYLKNLPVHKVKIDKSFIFGLPHDKGDIVIVKAIIALSKSLGLSIIAEGVETEEQKDLIFEYGCELIQGYYYYKAMHEDEIEKVLLKEKN